MNGNESERKNKEGTKEEKKRKEKSGDLPFHTNFLRNPRHLLRKLPQLIHHRINEVLQLYHNHDLNHTISSRHVQTHDILYLILKQVQFHPQTM